MVNDSMRTAAILFWASSVLGCSSTVEIDVQIVDPCNQDAVSKMELFTFVPQGTGLDSEGLSTTVQFESRTAQPLEIPLVSDFRLLVRGYGSLAELEDRDVKGLGVSSEVDLTADQDRFSVRVLFTLVNELYQTTAVDQPATCSSLTVDRYGHTATYLPESGKVLIVGGARVDGDSMQVEYPRAVELYDPDTGAFEVVDELRLADARAFHTATLLNDGRVLIAGGEAEVSGQRQSLESAFLIDASDPSRVTRSSVPLTMKVRRSGHRAVRLGDGRVLFLGGRVLGPGGVPPHTFLSSVELYDPQLDLFILPNDGQMNRLEMVSARYGHSATVLGNGRDVFVAGGRDESGPVATPELLRLLNDNNTFTASAAAATIGVGPIFHAAAPTPDGLGIMLSGGYDRTADAEPVQGRPVNPRSDVEVWVLDEATGVIERGCSANLSAARGFHTLSVVGNRVVFAGGRTADGLPTAGTEWATVNPNLRSPDCFATLPGARMMSDARADHSAVVLQRSGEILFIGGRQQAGDETSGRSIGSAEVFSPARRL